MKISSIIPIIFFCLLITSCDKRGENYYYDNQILLLGNGAEPEALDPHTVTGVPESHIITALYEGLIGSDPKTLRPIADALAERWKISKDLKTYTFYFRKNATWSNGDPVTANDFVYSYHRAMHPDLASQYAYMFAPVLNATEFISGKIKDFSKVGIKAIDKYTLEINLHSPTPYFLELIKHHSWFPVHPPTVEKYGKMTDLNSPWAKEGKIVTNGAFKLKRWIINSKIIVEKRHDYWDSELVKLNQIHFLAISNQETEQRAFQKGQLHVTGTPPTHRIKWARKHSPNKLLISPYLGVFYFSINVSNTKNANKSNNDALNSVANKKVRQAIAKAIDREGICKFLDGGQTPAYNFTPPNTAGYFPKIKIKPSVKEARNLLAEAGFKVNGLTKEGKDFPQIELLYPSSETNKQLSELIQANLKESLGINIELNEQQWKVYLDNVKQKNYQIARSAWIGDYNDPNTFLDMWITNGGNNRTGFSNSKYDDFIYQASREGNHDKRLKLFQKAEAILTEELPVIPIYFWVRVAMIDPKLKGWYPNIFDHHPYKYLSF